MSGDQIPHVKDNTGGLFGGIAEGIIEVGLKLSQEAQEAQKEQQKQQPKNSGTQNSDRPFFERADTSEDFLLSREELKNGLKGGSEKDPEIRGYTKVYENFDKIGGDDKLLSVMEIVMFEIGQMGYRGK